MQEVVRSSLSHGKGFDNEFVHSQCSDRRFKKVSVYVNFDGQELYDRDENRNNAEFTNIF
jgi:hypothetical protein